MKDFEGLEIKGISKVIVQKSDLKRKETKRKEESKNECRTA